MNNEEQKFEPQNIKKVLEEILNQKQLKDGINNVKLAQIWEEVMGGNIKKYTEAVELENEILYVSLTSAPLKMELTHNKPEIIQRLNKTAGSILIKKLILR